jgi:hypothetical protein
MKSKRPVLQCLIAAAGFCACRLTAAEIVNNGSFESNQGAATLPAGWVVQSSAPGVAVQVSNARIKTGAWAVRVTGRTDRVEGIRQSVTAALGASGSGVRRVCRGWVWLDDFASVRLLLRYADSSGQKPDLLLAERIVRTPGQWVEVAGDSTITWTGTLQSAALVVEVMQLSRQSGPIAARLLPDYYVDGVTMDNDSDGDGIMDRDEAALGLSPALADTDGDGLPDRWEIENGYSPLSNEAGLDSDGDGFSNGQEFWAATDPRSATSYPGKPSNPNLNTAASAVLRWLALLPSQAPGRHLAVGQNLSDLGSAAEYDSLIGGLGAGTGKFPAILSMAIEPPYDRAGIPLQIAEAESRALAYWQAGGLVMLKWAIYNPWVTLNSNVQTGADLPGLVDPASSAPATQAANQAAHDRLLGWMATVADAIARLDQQGVVVMLRPISEMNGSWFWWGHRERSEYLALWRFIRDYFTVTRGLNNIIWVYESDSGTHFANVAGGQGDPSDYYYPGDDQVDVMSHNFYRGTWVPEFEANEVYRRYPKVYGIPQAGPDHANRDGTFNNLTYVTQSAAALPRSSFLVVWNSFVGTDPATNLTAYRNVAIVDNANATALMNHPEIVTRESIPASARAGGVAPPAPGLINLSVRARVGAGASALITGFVIDGAGTKSVLVRAVGPTLAQFGLTGTLPSPMMDLYRGSVRLQTAVRWGAAANATQLRAAMTAVGAFALADESEDSALLVPLGAGAHTVLVSDRGDGTGLALVEVYDAAGGAEVSRLRNLSIRGEVGTGANALIGGFVIGGTQSRPLLIRASGPALAQFGLTGVLADPQLTLYRGSSVVATNDNWSMAATAELTRAATTQSGAFPLVEGGLDSAIVVTLDPGAYTVNVAGSNATTGLALVEVYDVGP